MLRFLIDALFNLLIKNFSTLILVRQEPTYHSIEDNPTAPDISQFRIISLFHQHLRWSIARTATRGQQFLILLIEITKPEINKLNIILMIDQYIFRLDIPMRNPNRMQILHSIDQLLKKNRSSRLRKSSPKLP